MVTVSPEIIATLVRHFSHGAGKDFDPSVEHGCQRESLHDLGFGWVYLGLARLLQPQKALVIGSGRGFAAACIGLGMKSRPEAQVTLVDPGYRDWAVEGGTDKADGFWENEVQAVQHFQAHLGLSNVKLLRMQSDEAFLRFAAEPVRFDLILIDGEHSYIQALADLRHAEQCLNTGGIILAHDSCCPQWPGVALALEALTIACPWLETLSLPCYPGLTLIKKREPFIHLRTATPLENQAVNSWRSAAGVTNRPLPQGDDPQPGVPGADPREGLFSVFAGSELIGGIGVRRRHFSRDGEDNFIPDTGVPIDGYLAYGLVLRPEWRGQRCFQRVICELLRWFPQEGLYAITAYPQQGRAVPYVIERVGCTAHHTAFRYHLPPPAHEQRRSALCPARELIECVQLQQALAVRQCELDGERRHCAELQAEVRRLERERDEIVNSTSWRWSYPARLIGSRARRTWRKLRVRCT